LKSAKRVAEGTPFVAGMDTLLPMISLTPLRYMSPNWRVAPATMKASTSLHPWRRTSYPEVMMSLMSFMKL
jgi:hypothetical protein